MTTWLAYFRLVSIFCRVILQASSFMTQSCYRTGGHWQTLLNYNARRFNNPDGSLRDDPVNKYLDLESGSALADMHFASCLCFRHQKVNHNEGPDTYPWTGTAVSILCPALSHTPPSQEIERRKSLLLPVPRRDSYELLMIQYLFSLYYISSQRVCWVACVNMSRSDMDDYAI
ncbi:hypothetical protein BGY98DRAFT_972060 [Russula aff. rugulosa BPL654]|nr:hypothetical protein BGY98DRAFT_972060 [Russula aff. rugulosa BPL654]